MQENAIVIKGLKKQYRLGQIGGGTLTADLQSWWAKVRHKEDPNSKIGTDQRLLGQQFWALNGIDLEIKKGEALGIIGGNGAGKSTMLKILSRITAPTEGSVDIYGRIASMLEVGTGFSPEMTGRENIYMNGAILGMTKAEIDAKMEDIIEFSEVREFIDTPVKRYSSGMYVKLAFSVAAHLDSEIMIMDEVLAVGDMAFQKKCLDKMRDAATVQGKTVLYVSHNMNTIRKLCDRCIVLDQGRIIFDGDVEEAIAVYMQNKKSLGITEFDLEHTKNRSRYGKGKARIYRLKLLDKEEAIYKAEEPIRFELQVRAKKSIKDLRVRLELRFGDETPIGTVPSTVLGCVEGGETATYLLEFTPLHLTKGTYRVDMVLFELDEFGNSFDQDLILPIFDFDIQEEEGIVWNPNTWGHIRFPDIKLIDQ